MRHTWIHCKLRPQGWEGLQAGSVVQAGLREERGAMGHPRADGLELLQAALVGSLVASVAPEAEPGAMERFLVKLAAKPEASL